MEYSVNNFKHAKDRKSHIPSVPANYTYSKRQKAGKSFIPRIACPSKLPDNESEKFSLSRINSINHFNLKKEKTLFAPVNYCKPATKNTSSHIPRIKATKKVVPRQEKSLDKPTTTLFGKSKIPVPISTKKAKVSIINSTKKTDIKTRTSIHIRTCTSTHIRTTSTHIRTCTSTIKKKDVRACVSVKKKNQVHISSFNAIKDDDTKTRVLTFDAIKKDENLSRFSTLTSIKKSLIPVRKSKYNLFKKRVVPLQPSSLISVQNESFAQSSTFILKEQNSLVYTTLKNKRIPLQKYVNNPEASIFISHNVLTSTSIIKPELSSISLLYKAEKDLSTIKHQAEENDENSKLNIS
ncbi:17685_t:CDS:1 [Funneliformis geosporum]|uniref:11464_t:CDS:1 n=1 Tax=Funneliformis geosporum TaxID=1117311 RepID=A0A9W4WSH6_9GLOM|nr:17685_t:CDS:1 [Funneliformis geosporum]CAI2182923.1 11464_t:CDS:1 [Funneliformis geosporum]